MGMGGGGGEAGVKVAGRGAAGSVVGELLGVVDEQGAGVSV